MGKLIVAPYSDGAGAVLSERRCWRLLYIAVTAAMLVAFRALPANAVAIEPEERLNLRMVAPIPNNSTFRVWGSKYYPGDVLSEHMTEHLYRRFREIPRLKISKVASTDPNRWPTTGFTPSDLVVSLTLEEASFGKSDRIGSKTYWDVQFHMHVFNASSRRLVYENVVQYKDSRHYPLYNDVMEYSPIYWAEFEKSPYWGAVRHALDMAFDEVIEGYNGYRIVGRIVAKAERVDGSLTVPKKDRDKLYHIDLGREDSVRVGDLLSVTRSSSVRTISPEDPEMHFPQVVARVKVLYIKGQDAVVQVIKQSKEAPIMLGDSVSAPLFGKRGSRYY